MHRPEHIPLQQRRLQDSVRSLPPQTQDDLNPRNLLEIDQTMRMRDMQNPRQQAFLLQERQRLEKLMAQKMEQAAQQQFMQRLEQRLNAGIGTETDTDPKARFMYQMMQQMQRRHGQLR